MIKFLINIHINLNLFTLCQKKVVGESFQQKISKVTKILKKQKSDYLFLSAPENVAWLLNIRGFDNPNSPIPNCRLLLIKDKNFFLISEKNQN